MSMFFMRSDSPEFDAELAITDRRPVICECDICGGEIHKGDDFLEGDDYYLMEDGTTICKENGSCLIEWADDNFLQRG